MFRARIRFRISVSVLHGISQIAAWQGRPALDLRGCSSLVKPGQAGVSLQKSAVSTTSISSPGQVVWGGGGKYTPTRKDGPGDREFRAQACRRTQSCERKLVSPHTEEPMNLARNASKNRPAPRVAAHAPRSVGAGMRSGIATGRSARGDEDRKRVSRNDRRRRISVPRSPAAIPDPSFDGNELEDFFSADIFVFLFAPGHGLSGRRRWGRFGDRSRPVGGRDQG